MRDITAHPGRGRGCIELLSLLSFSKINCSFKITIMMPNIIFVNFVTQLSTTN